MFPLVKELLCRGERPNLSAAAQHVSAGRCFPLSVWFFSFQHIVISFRLLVWPLTVHFHSQCRTFMAVWSCFARPPTLTNSSAVSFTLFLSLSALYERTCAHKMKRNHHSCTFPSRLGRNCEKMLNGKDF